MKSLIQSFGLTTIDSPDEGEKLCSYLAKHNIVDGIITEDSDVFVYGCKKIYRNISFTHNSIIEYDLDYILEQLDLSMDEFIYLCIISQNDYNHNSDHIINNYKEWMIFKRTKLNILEYILDNDEILKKITSEEIVNMKKMYSFVNSELIKYKGIIIKNGPINKVNIQNIMEDFDFVFVL